LAAYLDFRPCPVQANQARLTQLLQTALAERAALVSREPASGRVTASKFIELRRGRALNWLGGVRVLAVSRCSWFMAGLRRN